LQPTKFIAVDFSQRNNGNQDKGFSQKRRYLCRCAILAEANCTIYLIPLAEANGNEKSQIFTMAFIRQWA